MKKLSLLLGLALALPALASAQDNQAQGTLHTRAADGLLKAVIEIDVGFGWHLYHTDVGGDLDEYGDRYPAKPLQIVPRADGVTWSDVRMPAPERYEDKALGNWANIHHGRIVAYVAGTYEGEAPGEVKVALDGLTCSEDGTCIEYRETLTSAGEGKDALFEDFPADLAPGAAAGAQASGGGGGPMATPIDLPEASFFNKARSRMYLRRDGDRARVVIEIDVEDPWYLYHTELGGPPDAPYPSGKPLVVEMQGSAVQWSAPHVPDPEKYEDKALDSWCWIHRGVVRVYLAGEVGEGVGELELGAALDGLTCNSESGTCVPFTDGLRPSGEGPDEAFEDFPEELFESLAAGSTAANGGSSSSGNLAAGAGAVRALPDGDWDSVTFGQYAPADDGDARGVGLWLLLAFLAGMILNVMPCVLPVVSIKVLSFVQQAGESRSRVLALGLAFSAGIIVVFLVLAGLAAFAGQGWGEQFQSPTFQVVMIGIVFAFSLSMFDVFEIGVPSQVGALAGGAPREGLGDAFFKGIMATVLATPCSGPFLGSTLAWAVAQDSKLTVFSIFFTIGLGMAFPYVLLTANPRLLKVLPKPGAWMQTFKHLMGFVLLATVVYLMTFLREDNLLFTVGFLLFVAAGCWYWGKYATFGQKLPKRVATLAITALIIGGGARLAFVEFKGLFTPDGDGLAWEVFDPRKLEQYHDEGRSVFVDFTADWCPNCKANEALVFESDAVRKAIEDKGVAVMKADITQAGEYSDMVRRLMGQLGSVSIPFLAVFPGDDPTRPIVKRDIVTRGTMVEVFKSLPDPPLSVKPASYR